MPSLQNLCRVPSLVEILNHPHLKKEIFCSPINDENFKERDVALQKAVSEFMKDFHNVLKEFTPKPLIPLIGFEMWKWAEYQKEYFNLPFKFSESFIERSLFTSKGLIDEEKAARKLLMEPSLSTFLKYSIACHYFLEDVIPGFWQTLPKDKRNFREMLKDHKSRMPMILWYDYLKKKKETVSTSIRKVITRKFKFSVFSYGLMHKNIAAVKFSLGSKEGSRKDKNEAKIIRKLVYKSFCDYVSPILKNKFRFVSDRSFFTTEFLLDSNIILYFINLLKKSVLKEFLINHDSHLTIIKLLLLRPNQHQFMDLSNIIFENFNTEKYHEILGQIIFLTENQCVCETYNYRLLFKEFWIKSPSHMKKEIISSESNDTFDYNLIEILAESRNFTSGDLANINLMLEYADSVERHNIFLNQGAIVLYNIIVSHSRFDLADLFLKNLDINQETLETIKKDFILYSIPDIMEKQDINLLDKIFKWVVGSDDLDDFKEDIFHRLTNSKKIEHLFLGLKEDIPFSFLNKITKWFLKTDDRIEEWKKNIVYSPFFDYSNYMWFDRLLKYQGHSEEEASIIKREFLFIKFPEIARSFLNYGSETRYLSDNVFCLCSHEKEKFREFIYHLRSFYQHSIKQKMCLICLNNIHVFDDGEEAQIYCENHGMNGFISLNEANSICSELSEQFVSELEFRESVFNFLNFTY